MASRLTRSLSSLRRHSDSLSSLNRIFSSSSSSPIRRTPLLPTFSRATQPFRYFGSNSAINEETAANMKGQAYSLASLNTGITNQLCENRRMFQATSSIYRSFASASESSRQKQTEGKKDISTVEDPFDSPTYHIPEKPVTFTEGASYSIVILAGLGIAAVAAYGVFKELIFEPKEYKVFNKALDRIQNDSQVRVRIGSPVKGYGQESRNRAARQRIPHRVWTDEHGVEHIEVNFYIRGPSGNGKVYCEMFKDKEDNQWKYMYMIVDILHPSQTKLILESFLPA
ncbi:probable mitochondrial import inner membrane translocase subunit TIM21 [Chenopodium quinoa]|uniref:probable mitochondrial import inner membrane translocase subunit TIM21 n=1 Tax=Chenopodium quinoa TaxID=63459 RepID=UPI000B76DB7D|nr:probable mitochondrial import inner membrane translocase subunit TIM21 [Chenopodium quinoa]